MTWWPIVVWGAMALIWAMDALRLRGLTTGMRFLPPSEKPVSPDHRFLIAPGLELDDATMRAASAFARREGLDVVDLVPRDLPVWRAILLLVGLGFSKAGGDKFASGCSAGYALLVSASVLERTRAAADPGEGLAGLLALASRFKYFAPQTTGVAVLPQLSATSVTDDAQTRRLVFQHVLGSARWLFVATQMTVLVLLLVGPFVSLLPGLIALAVFNLHPLIVFAGTSLAPRDLLLQPFFRAPLDLIMSLRLFPMSSGATTLGEARQLEDPIESRRPRYEELWAGAAEFFEPRRSDCPLCGSAELKLELETKDLSQRKPGRFHLESCGSCGHIFQNPRLSVKGLEYYYSDFYDGLGEEMVETAFAGTGTEYEKRARVMEGLVTPRSWLDVGAGHGHFALVLRGIWKGVRIDGLDLSESIEEAERRGWVDHGYRGLFPEMGPALAAQGRSWDVVSMNQYLEHTTDPRAELAAAHHVLPEGGYLYVDVPDPECKFRKLLGRYWLAYFQPQHLHFVSMGNMERLLKEEGFVPVRRYRFDVAEPRPFLAALTFFLRGIIPVGNVPWLPRPGWLTRAAVLPLWILAMPLMAFAWLADRIIGEPLVHRAEGWTSAYGVVARKASKSRVQAA